MEVTVLAPLIALASLYFEQNCHVKRALCCDQFLIEFTQWPIQDNFPFKN